MLDLPANFRLISFDVHQRVPTQVVPILFTLLICVLKRHCGSSDHTASNARMITERWIEARGLEAVVA